MDTVPHYEGEISESPPDFHSHTVSFAYLFNVYSPFKRQRNTSPASNTNNDKSADAAPESDTFH